MAPPHLTAWMDIAQRVAIDRTIVFELAKLNGSDTMNNVSHWTQVAYGVVS